LPLEDNCNRTFFIFSIFSFLYLNILHTKIEDVVCLFVTLSVIVYPWRDSESRRRN